LPFDTGGLAFLLVELVLLVYLSQPLNLQNSEHTSAYVV
jgi:hypothetical protein